MIYDEAMKNRSIREKELMENAAKTMEENFWQYAGVRIQKLIQNVVTMRASGNYNETMLQEAET